MEINQRGEAGVLFLDLTGQFETFSLPAFSDLMREVIDRGGRRVCINCVGVSFINSTALGYLVEIARRLKDLHGELVLSEPSRFVADTIRTLELHHLFEIFSTDAEAAAHFA